MIRRLLAWACLIAAVGCGGDSAKPTPSDAGSQWFDAGVSLSGLFYEYQQGADTTLAAVEICIEKPRRCVMSNQGGRFVLDELEPEREILLTFSKRGYVPTLFALVTPRWSSTLGRLFLTRNEDVDILDDALRAAGRTDIEPDSHRLPSTSFSAVGGLGWNVRVHLDPDPGSEPFYVLDSGELVLEIPSGRTATFGEYIGVSPSEDYELVYEINGGACNYYASALGGWRPNSGRPNATRVPVRDGFMTYTTLEDCSLESATQ